MSQHETSRTNGSIFSSAGPDGAISRIFMHGAGHTASSLSRSPVIGICASKSDFVPCNHNQDQLVTAAKEGIIAAGGQAFEFPTISLGEPFIRPTTMYLRNLMAMDVEEMVAASPIDGVLLIGGCDKTVPAQLMGAISAGKPALQIVSGPRPEVTCLGRRMSVEDLWPLMDQRRAGSIPDGDWGRVERELNSGTGTCNVLGTATTMAAVAEILGFALPGSSLPGASTGRRIAIARETGSRLVAAIRENQTPQRVVTKHSLENAFRAVAAISGSTNAIIHLHAIAGRAGIVISDRELDSWLAGTPTLVSVKPSGEHSLEDLDQAGGIPAVVTGLRELFHVDCITASGEPWSSHLVDDVVQYPVGSKSTQTSSLVMLRGSLAPGGALLKRAAAEKSLWKHTGPAVVFENVQDLHRRIDDPALNITADSVLVLRTSGPVGGPGMPEIGQIPIPKSLFRMGVRDMVRISDARMSGTATGCCILHVSPESAVGGPLALVSDGDLIALDAELGVLDLLVSAGELATRTASLAPTPERGYSALYHQHVLQAEDGCDFDFLTASTRATT